MYTKYVYTENVDFSKQNDGLTLQILLLLPGVRLTTRRPDSTQRVWWRPSPTCIPKASSTETSNQRTLYWTAGATPSWWDGSLGISHVKRQNDESRSAPFVAAARESADIWRALSGKTKVCSAHYISTLEVSRVLWFLGRCHPPPQPPTHPLGSCVECVDFGRAATSCRASGCRAVKEVRSAVRVR